MLDCVKAQKIKSVLATPEIISITVSDAKTSNERN